MMFMFNTKTINYFIHIEFIFIFIFTHQFQNKINKKFIYEFEFNLSKLLTDWLNSTMSKII
jgi:hypothetical protein